MFVDNVFHPRDLKIKLFDGFVELFCHGLALVIVAKSDPRAQVSAIDGLEADVKSVKRACNLMSQIEGSPADEKKQGDDFSDEVAIGRV